MVTSVFLPKWSWRRFPNSITPSSWFDDRYTLPVRILCLNITEFIVLRLADCWLGSLSADFLLKCWMDVCFSNFLSFQVIWRVNACSMKTCYYQFWNLSWFAFLDSFHFGKTTSFLFILSVHSNLQKQVWTLNSLGVFLHNGSWHFPTKLLAWLH